MRMLLFRPEATAGRHDEALTSIVLTPPVRASVVGWSAAIVLAVCAVAACFVEYTHKLHVQAWLMPDSGLLEVYSSQSGIVTQAAVTQGSHVRKGDLLFVISSDKTSPEFGLMGPLAKSRLRAQMQSLERESNTLNNLQRISKAEAEHRAQRYKADLQDAQAERDLVQARIDLARKEIDRSKLLLKEHFIADADYEQRLGAYMELQAAVITANLRISSLTAEVKKTESDYENLSAELSLRVESIERDISSLQELQYDRALVTSLGISAPTDAIVSSKFAVVGSSVNTSTPLAVLLPERTPLQIHALVTGKVSGLVKPGQTVTLFFDDRLLEPVFARVSWISPAPLPESGISSKFGISHGRSAYELIISLPAEAARSAPEYIRRAGAEIEANIFVEKKSVARWILGLLMGADEVGGR